jgi:hypothetical protein
VRAALGTITPELDLATASMHLDLYLADLMCRYEGDGNMTGVASTATRAGELARIFEAPIEQLQKKR